MAEVGTPEGGKAPITRAFMEQLLGAFCEDFATLKQEIAAEVKDLKRDVANLGQRVDTLEQRYRLEDLENRSCCSNIRIKGVTAQAVTLTLENFVVRLFRPVAPALKDQSIVLDQKHKAGCPAHSPGQAQNNTYLFALLQTKRGYIGSCP
ncbi:hypothetical protein NDU88_009756 [Pleurodeles waltl]|uniref:Uncharacterized protein n=1 Tax=Pleurodeles waltl TaxID=8319 RepID=A0AAV7RW46_PLEWA|nr:hypothetical protein NDU88_009756 [Pleurodeles waltl]